MVRKEQYPIQKNLTWCLLKKGLPLANADTKEVERIAGLLGEPDLVANAIAFGADKVGLGTDKGLLAWDRKDMFWTRVAVGGKFVDLAVTEMTFEADKLKVTVDQEGKPRSFEL